MLDLRYVTENLDEVRKRLATRGNAPGLDRLAELAHDRRTAIVELETARAQKNDATKAMASLDKKSAEFTAKRDELKQVGERIKAFEARHKEVEAQLEELMLNLPNLPADSTPVGKHSDDNVERRRWGDKPSFSFTPKDHVEIGTKLGILEFDRAAKVHGARFTVLRGAGARLERALMQFMLDLHVDHHGYEELWPPALVRDSALLGTGNLPKFEADLFKVARHYAEGDESERYDLYLSPTAEVQITNFRGNEIFEPGELPKKYCAYTPCFRSEAGSYGKDTRGLIRQHQFDKVELVHFATPDQAEAEHEKLVASAEEVLKQLNLHYRVMQLCTGDLGFGAAKCYDLEVWLPGQDAFREISSCSWFGDFQARRAKIRFRSEAGAKPQIAHTLNGSGLAIGRTLVAILEQCQQADGSVIVPQKLRPYMGGRERITV
jgi:seryl-tRNA synthetase